MKKNNINSRRVRKILSAVRTKYGITDRPLNQDDFYRICKGENIFLVDRRVKLPRNQFKALRNIQGCYARTREGEKFIFLASFWKRKLDMFVALHELGHHFMGHVEGSFDPNIQITRNETCEAEADLFAELASGGLKRRQYGA